MASERPAWLRALDADPAYAWARRAWDVAARWPDAWFDEAKAEAVVAGWPEWFRLTDDRFAGKPFRLSVWQAIVVRLLVGWKRPISVTSIETGAPEVRWVRVFRRLDLWIPRKNGKSEFLAALALLFFMLEEIPGAQGFAFARDEDQARLVFTKMQKMIRLSPRLGEARAALMTNVIFVPGLESNFHLLPGTPGGTHGKSPTVILGDEMHEWRTTEVADNLREGTGTRLQPVELYASTAGLRTALIGYGLFQEAMAILDGTVDEPTTLVVWFGAQAEDDWQDEAIWAAANPTVGLTPTWDYLRQAARKAKNNPRLEANFKRYHLNQWVESEIRWLPRERWLENTTDATAWRTRHEQRRGRKAFGALDVSATRDVTALLWLFPPETDDGAYEVACQFWIPEATLAKRAAEDRRTPWEKWVADGVVLTTPGDMVDQGFVMRAILDGFAAFDVQALAYDPWNTAMLVTELQKEGVPPDQMVEFRQGIRSMGEPSKQFERLVYGKKFDHGGHPMLAWMAGNATIRFDENMNFMPAKKASPDKIDGIVAAVMAVGLTMRPETPAPGIVAL